MYKVSVWKSYSLIALFLSFFCLSADSLFALSAKCDLAEELYLKGEYKAAASECERLFFRYKGIEFKSEVAYLAGLSFLKLNDLSKARTYFEYTLDNSDDQLLIGEAQIALKYVSGHAPAVKEGTLFSVQIGSFKKSANAKRLYKKFKKKRYTVRIVKDRDGWTIVYKVKIGRFSSKDEAAQFAKRLKKMGYPTAIVAY